MKNTLFIIYIVISSILLLPGFYYLNFKKVNDDFIGLLFVFVILIIFIIIFILTIYYKIKRIREQKKLDFFGTKIMADNLVIKKEPGGKYSYFYIMAQWLNPKDDKVYIFHSDYLNYNPENILPEKIEVVILPDNPRIYRMDLLGLSKVVKKL